MYPVLFPADATAFNSFGIGVLSDAISCEVEENRNGAYELEMRYPITGAFYDSLALRTIILAKPNYTDAPQPFRIYGISKPLNWVVTVNAQHISYDLSGYVDAPFTAADISIAIGKITDANIIYPTGCPFSFTTDIQSAAQMELKHPESVRGVLGGTEGSFIDTYGGEWHFDGYNCELKLARGEDRGAVIRYGKNLTDLRQEENNAEVYTAVYPYYYNADTETLVTLSEKVIQVSGTFPYTRIFPLNLSFDFEETPNQTELRAKAQSYIASNNIGVPKVNLTVSFLEEGSMPERIDLCDLVSVRFDALGVTAMAKCIRTKWDVLKGRYIEAELGSARKSFTETIADSVEIARAIDHRTAQFQSIATGIISKVTGNEGGYIVLHDTNDDGEPDEILIMDSDDITQAVKVIRMNNAGIAFSNTGYTGTYTTAWNINGQFVANFIAAGELQTDRVKILGDTQFYWDNSNITLIDPQDLNRMIRFGKYNGTDYGLGFSKDGGLTWTSGFNFDGIKLIGDIDSTGRASMDGDSFDIINGSNVNITHLGIGTVNLEDGTIGQRPFYRLGTYKTGGTHGEYSFSGGRFSNPSGPFCVCVGYNNDATGFASIALGRDCISDGYYTVAMGKDCHASGGADSGEYAGGVAIGSQATAEKPGGVAIGSHPGTTGTRAGVAIGNFSVTNCGGVAIGNKCKAEQTKDEFGGVAIGNVCTAERSGSVSIGISNEVSGRYAVAIGGDCESTGKGACAIGEGLRATNANQFICGKYNAVGTWKFVVGNGTDDSNRSNALRMSNAGNMWIAGTLTQGSDARQKDVIGEPPDLSGVRAVRFRWNENKKNHDDSEHIGYLAQDIEKVAPYLVEVNDDDGYKSLNYTELLCAKIEQLERTVEHLTKRVEELEGVKA